MKKPKKGDVFILNTKSKADTPIPKELHGKIKLVITSVHDKYSNYDIRSKENPELIEYYSHWDNIPYNLKKYSYMDHGRIGSWFIPVNNVVDEFPIW